MGDRPISDLQRQWLQGEIEAWRKAGVVGPDQAERILAAYESPATTGHRKRSLASFVLQAISAILVGLATLLVIAYNWDALGRPLKLAIIFGVIAATYALGFYLRTQTQAQRMAQIVFFLGCLFYGCGIWLIALVFNLDSHAPDGLWWWALGVLPFALALDTLLLHALYGALLAIWCGMEITGYAHLTPWFLFHWWPNGAFSLPVLAAPGLFWAYRRGSPWGVGLYVGLLAWWVILQAIGWDLEWHSVFLVGAVGGLMLIIAENHRRLSALAAPYRTIGTLMVCAALIPPSFPSFHRQWSYYRDAEFWQTKMFGEIVLFLVIFAALVSFGYLLRPLEASDNAKPFNRLLEVFRRQWMPVGIVLAMAVMALLSHTGEEGSMIAVVLANVMIIVFALYLMQVGLREERGKLFAAGVIYFLLWIVFRYTDLIGQRAGVLGAALMFFVCGGVLFGLSMLWGRRKGLKHV